MIWIALAAIIGALSGLGLYAVLRGAAINDVVDADFIELPQERTARLARGGEIDLHV
jgi:hypothetical protein